MEIIVLLVVGGLLLSGMFGGPQGSYVPMFTEEEMKDINDNWERQIGRPKREREEMEKLGAKLILNLNYADEEFRRELKVEEGRRERSASVRYRLVIVGNLDQWKIQILLDKHGTGKEIVYGTYDTKEEAYQAYISRGDLQNWKPIVAQDWQEDWAYPDRKW